MTDTKNIKLATEYIKSNDPQTKYSMSISDKGIDVSKELSFPKLDGGWCDGMGCGDVLMGCWCSEYLECCEEYQREFKKPWDRMNPECIVWEKSWRFSWGRYVNKELEKKKYYDR
jgi:hypothetical protein